MNNDQKLVAEYSPVIDRYIADSGLNPTPFYTVLTNRKSTKVQPDEFLAPGFFNQFKAAENTVYIFANTIQSPDPDPPVGIFLLQNGYHLVAVLSTEPDEQLTQDRNHLNKCFAL